MVAKVAALVVATQQVDGAGILDLEREEEENDLCRG